MACHPEQTQGWQGSHHALAERAVGPAERAALLRRPDVRAVGTELLLEPDDLPITGILGVDPIWQPLITEPDGRVQAFDEGWDVAREEWFSVFADSREPGDWGHWTGRGMTWNTMCGECHNTGFEKRYDLNRDRYQTTVSERGVGCEACHGPGSRHAEQPTVALGIPQLEDCGGCHSRRASLSDDGETFLDRYALQTLSDPGLYYADGQIHDEVFELASFLSSRMHQEGVTCSDCHDAHSGQLQRAGDDLCLSCHAAQETWKPHDHHPVGSVGCVDCHMPETTYMERHPRRDHGFTVPDPGLTLEAGVPNACQRCHEEGAQWALGHTTAWFGDKLTDRQRRARATAGLLGLDGLLAVSRDPHPYWRAGAMGLLVEHITDPEAVSALLRGLQDEDALVRAKAAGALAPRLAAGEAPVVSALQAGLADPVRAVRVASARALRQGTTDLQGYLMRNADQPAALLELSSLVMDRDPASALPLLTRAVDWNGDDPQARMALAIVSSRLGDHDRAGEELKAVTSLAPDRAEGWYMLGLHHSGRGRIEPALAALENAAGLAPQNPDPPFAMATILRDQGRDAEALTAAHQAVSLGHPQSAALLRSLTPGSP